MSTEKVITDVLTTTIKATEAALKKAWSLMDAAAEKKPPTEVLSSNAIKAIQGVTKPNDQ